MKKGYVYIMSNKNRTVLYVGMSMNIIKRISDHKAVKGAKFTKKYAASDLLYYELVGYKWETLKREKQLKNWHKEWKWNLINENNPELIDLYEEMKTKLEAGKD